MKIKVKQISWSRGGAGKEIDYEYEVELKKEIIVDSMKYSTYEKGKAINKIETIFSFKVLETGLRYAKIKINGEAGGIYSQKKNKYIPREIILQSAESFICATQKMDMGGIFTISIG